MQRFIRLCALLLLGLAARLEAQFSFVTNNGALTITAYSGAGGAVVIPDTTNGLPVVNIGTGAFSNKVSVTFVGIPNTITNVGTSAFQGCSSLGNVAFGTGVISIGQKAFFSCVSLTNFILPETTINIGSYAFQNCPLLSTVTVPDTVTNLGFDAFAFCFGLRNAVIGNGVLSLQGTFWECQGLQSVTIGTGVTSISTGVFFDCTSLTNVALPGSVTNIGTPEFRLCASLEEFTVDTNNPAYSSVDGVLFDKMQTALVRCPPARIGGYTIPDSVASLSTGAFWDCNGLSNVTIGSGASNLGDRPFNFCANMQSIDVNAANPNFSGADGVLFDRSQTTLVGFPVGRAGRYTLPGGVVSIGTSAFEEAGLLTSVTIPSSVTNLQSYAFYYCSSLASVMFLGNAPASLGTYIFYGNSIAWVYYLPGATGWGQSFAGRPTALWNPQVQTSDGSFGVVSNQFGFNITGSTNIAVVVEACSALGGAWNPLCSVSLTNGTFYFSDPQWTNFPSRFYRLRAP